MTRSSWQHELRSGTRASLKLEQSNIAATRQKLATKWTSTLNRKAVSLRDRKHRPQTLSSKIPGTRVLYWADEMPGPCVSRSTWYRSLFTAIKVNDAILTTVVSGSALFGCDDTRGSCRTCSSAPDILLFRQIAGGTSWDALARRRGR